MKQVSKFYVNVTLSLVKGGAAHMNGLSQIKMHASNVMSLTSSQLKRKTLLYPFLFEVERAKFSYYINDAVNGKELVN